MRVEGTNESRRTAQEAETKPLQHARKKATRRSPAIFRTAASADFAAFRRAAESCPSLRVACDPSGDFLLHYAVTLGRTDLCQYLLDRGFPPDLPGAYGATPMHYAADNGSMQILRILQARHRGSLPINRHGMTPLHVAAGTGRLNLVKMLLQAPGALSQPDKFGRLPVHYASGANQTGVVRFLIRLHPPLLDMPDCFGLTPLHWAVLFECPDTAACLLRAGSDASAPDIYGRSSAWLLGHSINAEMQPLRQNCLPNTSSSGCAPLMRPPEHRAILIGDVAEAKRRLQEGGFRCRKDGLGWTALHAAAFARNLRLYHWLKGKKFDGRSVDHYGWTAPKLLSYRFIARAGT